MATNSSDQSIKQAACLNCRKIKSKCKRPPGASICDKCNTAGIQCIIPTFHIGRQKGVKNKRTGLAKAVFQIEEAIKKSRNDAVSNEPLLQQLQQLLNDARGPRPTSSDTNDNTSPTIQPSTTDREGSVSSSDDQFALHDAENPLQLLARASDIRLNANDPVASTPSTGKISSSSKDPLDLHRFFLPIKAKPDLAPDLDPIDLGLVDEEEANTHLSFFYQNLAHTRWGLDPYVHTLQFVRSRSAFLLTALLLASSRFTPGAKASALAMRLLHHRQFLVQQIIYRRYRSVEIVLAFLVSIPWIHPLEHSGDDDTGVFIAIALSVALDLSLNKIIVPSRSFDQALLKKLPKADCIDARKALMMDGFEDVEVESAYGQRLLRRRERVWMALFVLERGVCLARGRSYSVPVTPLIRHCDSWHLHQDADNYDGRLISMTVLRRDLDDLLTNVRSRCDNCNATDVGSEVAHEIERMIQVFFNNWHGKWTPAIGEGLQQTLPPYVEIMVTHLRLSTYGGVINHPTAPLEVKQQFRASALTSALQVMRVAIQSESRMMSMPNNTVIMICFAAIVALNLSTAARKRHDSLAPQVRGLIEETAAVLERIGSNPSHRNGASVIYGRYLREILRQAPCIETPSEPQPINHYPHRTMAVDMASQAAPAYVETQYNTMPSWPQEQPLQLSEMSSNQLNDMVMNAPEFDALLNFPLDDGNTFDWSAWMPEPDFGFEFR